MLRKWQNACCLQFFPHVVLGHCRTYTTSDNEVVMQFAIWKLTIFHETDILYS